MTKNEQFVKAHWTQVIILGIVSVLSVSWIVVLEDTNILKAKPDGMVLGETTINYEALNKTNPEEENRNKIIEYQNKLKKIISHFLKARAEFAEPHQDWLFLINKTKFELMTMSVPNEYQELHLQLAVVLDAEWQAVNESNNAKLREVDNRWKQILQKFFWLN